MIYYANYIFTIYDISKNIANKFYLLFRKVKEKLNHL